MPVKGERIDNFAGILNRYLQNLTLQHKFVIRITLPSDDAEAERLYERFLELKQLCEHSVFLYVMISLGADLPDRRIIDRFYSENMYAVQLPVSAFISNQKGFPVLSKVH